MISPEQESIIKDTLKRYSPSMVGIFGSYARNEQRESSDLDILIDFDQRIDLIELIGLEQELTTLLGIKVDLVTVRSLKPQLQPYVHQDLIRIL
jgi:predicted nucleotidyltransferase